MFGTFFWSFVLAVALLSLVKRYRRRAKKAQPARERHALDTWVESVVAAELARRMPWDEGELVNTLRTSPEPAVVGAIERSLRSVEMRFTRLPLGAEAEVKVDVSFERGENHQVTKRVRWGDLPEVVRHEFETKGAAVVFRRWQLPWSSTSTWSALKQRSPGGIRATRRKSALGAACVPPKRPRLSKSRAALSKSCLGFGRAALG